MPSVSIFSALSYKGSLNILHDLLQLFRLKLFPLMKPSFSHLSEMACKPIYVPIVSLQDLVEPR